MSRLYQKILYKKSKENGKNIVLFPIFEEGKNNTVKLKVWGKYCLETYTLEDLIKSNDLASDVDYK